MNQRKRQFLVVAGVVVLGATLGAGAARATFFCTQLDGLTIGVGEMRAKIVDGADSFYANAYADGGDEIAVNSDIILGKLSSMSATHDVSVAAFTMDGATADCGNIQHNFRLAWDQSGTLICTGPDGSATTTWDLNTCDVPNGDTFQGSRTLEHLALGHASNGASKFDVEVRVKRGGVDQDTDTDGCFVTGGSATCTAR